MGDDVALLMFCACSTVPCLSIESLQQGLSFVQVRAGRGG